MINKLVTGYASVFKKLLDKNKWLPATLTLYKIKKGLIHLHTIVSDRRLAFRSDVDESSKLTCLPRVCFYQFVPIKSQLENNNHNMYCSLSNIESKTITFRIVSHTIYIESHYVY